MTTDNQPDVRVTHGYRIPDDRKHMSELIRVLWEEVGMYSAQCAKTGELAPSKSLIDAMDAIQSALAAAEQKPEEGTMEEFAEAADLVGKVSAAKSNGEALAVILAYRKRVRSEALAASKGST